MDPPVRGRGFSRGHVWCLPEKLAVRYWLLTVATSVKSRPCCLGSARPAPAFTGQSLPARGFPSIHPSGSTLPRWGQVVSPVISIWRHVMNWEAALSLIESHRARKAAIDACIAPAKSERDEYKKPPAWPSWAAVLFVLEGRRARKATSRG